MPTNDGTTVGRGHTTPKHVWVRVTPDGDDAAPGILLDWRLLNGGPTWEAYVVWAAADGDGRTQAHLEWVSEDRVRPWA